MGTTHFQLTGAAAIALACSLATLEPGPPPTTAAHELLRRSMPGPDGEQALLGRIPGALPITRTSDRRTAQAIDGARALLGDTAPSARARSSSATGSGTAED
jgi:hypothetical protein